jgi:hypothetical protein
MACCRTVWRFPFHAALSFIDFMWARLPSLDFRGNAVVEGKGATTRIVSPFAPLLLR